MQPWAIPPIFLEIIKYGRNPNYPVIAPKLFWDPVYKTLERISSMLLPAYSLDPPRRPGKMQWLLLRLLESIPASRS